MDPTDWDIAQARLRMARPLQALELVAELRTTLDGLERRLVHEARLGWRTWHEIGQALGISRQGAQRRHGTRADVFGDDSETTRRRL